MTLPTTTQADTHKGFTSISSPRAGVDFGNKPRLPYGREPVIRRRTVEESHAVTVRETLALARRLPYFPADGGRVRVVWEGWGGGAVSLELVSEAMPGRGVRWRLRCPLCGVLRLALYPPPPGCTLEPVACRVCCGLSYTSSQLAHRIERQTARLARFAKCPPGAAAALIAFTDPDPRMRQQALGEALRGVFGRRLSNLPVPPRVTLGVPLLGYNPAKIADPIDLSRQSGG